MLSLWKKIQERLHSLKFIHSVWAVCLYAWVGVWVCTVGVGKKGMKKAYLELK